MRQDRHEAVSDPWLESLLADLRDDVPSDVDWEGMHRSVHARAEMVFARQRTQRSSLTRRRFVPLAVAASFALALWSGPALLERITDESPSAAMAVVELDSEAILLEALAGDLTDQEFDLLVTGRSNPEILLAVAISDR